MPCFFLNENVGSFRYWYLYIAGCHRPMVRGKAGTVVTTLTRIGVSAHIVPPSTTFE